ncbi:ATP-binding cassette domain-containing protein [Deinococcus cavernae]|uniref:ATP-binding cassette domain-containing protein n=1 Tax=Deinococcus cavernae TaxID=2320857 RepID=A0A418V7Z7_9DEIO|nr:ATP-binding cassette domain-containing protein [Deinococcus cavernae]RJF72215.1 ATP-binding cassette domain-containing protein [Deinococcus cavernae]
MIELKEVSHVYESGPVLQGVNLTLPERRIGVIGSNGSGKSTFARLLNGLLLPTHGQVLVDGLNTREQAREVRRRVGFVFQNPDNQIVFPVVEEDLAFGLKNLKLAPAEIEARITAVLARYDLQAFRQHSSHLLSGGQKQLMAISGVLVMQPEYVVFDEPTTLLDLRNRNRIVQVIRELPQTAIVVTHDLDLLADFGRVLVFDGGRVVMDAPPTQAIAFYRELMA